MKALGLFEAKGNNFEKSTIDKGIIYKDIITNTIYVIDTTQIKLTQPMFFFGQTEKKIACIKKLKLNACQLIDLESLKTASIVADSLASNGAEKSIESLLQNIQEARGDGHSLNLLYNKNEEKDLECSDPNSTEEKHKDYVSCEDCTEEKDDERQVDTNDQYQGTKSADSSKVKDVSNKEKAITIFSALLVIGGLVIILTELSLIAGIAMIVAGVLTFASARCYRSYNNFQDI